jgi:CHAD domain-containing protein
MDTGYRILAAQYIRRQAKQLAEQMDGVRAAEDIEFVHRARVATRRLRAAFRMFDGCFGRKRIRRWQRAIRRTTSALGDARDRDVQIELLCGTLSALSAKECFPGIARVLVQLGRDRERLQREVVKAVNRLEAKGTLREMRRVAKRLLAAKSPSDVPTNSAQPGAAVPQAAPPQRPQAPETMERIQRHVLRQLSELIEHQDSLASPDDRERHHAMRITAKRLRYTLEISRLVHPGRLDGAVEAIKKVQTLLGDIHDCDVWLDHLDAFARAERKRIVAMFGHAGRFQHLLPGIAFLQDDRRGHRQKRFQELVEYWAELDRQRMWDELRVVVHTGGEAPAAASPPAEAVTPMADAALSPIEAVTPPAQPATPPAQSPEPPAAGSQPRTGGNGADDDRPAAPKPLLTLGS